MAGGTLSVVHRATGSRGCGRTATMYARVEEQEAAVSPRRRLLLLRVVRPARTALPPDPRPALAAHIISGTACEALARRVAPGARLRARRHGSQPGRQARAKRAPRAAHANNPRAPRAPLTPQNAILHPVTPHLAPTRRALGQRRARMRPLSLQLERTQRFSSRFLNCAAPAPRARACCTHLIALARARSA